MKRLLLTTMALLLLISGVQAGQHTQFIGVTHKNGELGLTTGVGLRLSKNVWNINYATVNQIGGESVGSEAAYIWSYDDGGFYYGLLAGGSAEWVDGRNYITEAAGGIGGYRRVYAWAKYRLQLEKETGYENNFSFGAGFKVEW
jgi:hypothetical protein